MVVCAKPGVSGVEWRPLDDMSCDFLRLRRKSPVKRGDLEVAGAMVCLGVLKGQYSAESFCAL